MLAAVYYVASFDILELILVRGAASFQVIHDRFGHLLIKKLHIDSIVDFERVTIS